MVARSLVAPRPGWRVARGATQARRKHQRRMRYRLIARTVTALGVATVGLLVYLGLLANITRLNYDVGHAKETRLRLAAQTVKNDVVIAGLLSRDKLEAAARKLGMREAAAFEVVVVPPHPRRAVRPAGGVAFLAGMAGWFK